MLKALGWALAVILPVAIVTGAVVFARAHVIAEPEKLAAQGLKAVARQDGLGFGMLALFAGVAFAAIYAWVWPHWNGVTVVYAAAGILLGIGFSVAAAILRPRFGLGGVPEVLLLNVLWAAAFGALVPAVVRAAHVQTPRALYAAELARVEATARRLSDPAAGRREISSLPEPLQRFFRRAGVEGLPTMNRAAIEYDSALMRRTPASDWAPVRFEQVNFVNPPTRLVHIAGKFGALPMEARDAYVDGRGNMFIRLGGLVTVADGRGPQMDAAALVTFLAELPLVPSACLEPYVQWRQLDERRVEATLTHAGNTVRGVFEVEPNGEISRFTTDDRFLTEGKSYVRTRWSATLGEYARVGGLWLPTRISASWQLPGGEFEYARVRIRSVTYTPAPPGEPARTTAPAGPFTSAPGARPGLAGAR